MQVENAELYLVLGCFGRKETFSSSGIISEFVSCASCENKILKVSKDLNLYLEIMDYCDSCRLFDRPIFEQSAIVHFLRNIRDKFDQISGQKRFWSETQYQLYQKFVIDHRLCGLYVKLVLLDLKQEEVKPEEEKGIIIKNNLPVYPPKFDFNLTRGKRNK